MLENGTIEANQIWKRFRLDDRPTYLQDRIAQVGDRLRKRPGESWRWALSDIDFRAAPGESWALVGTNGAGKSTLLKIISRVMYQTAGNMELAGRVGALIEVRAGIAPLLTGRENIFLTGSIMGLKRRDVARRFDEIVAFAELEQAVDRQVKYYSSGMQMRLGFAVAAHLDPDILLVDEVLAVGDASFQQRCLDRIRQVLLEGTTLVFVSHDLAAVEAACINGIWMHNGKVQTRGPIREVLTAYRGAVEGDAKERPQSARVCVSRRRDDRRPTVGWPRPGKFDVDLDVEATSATGHGSTSVSVRVPRRRSSSSTRGGRRCSIPGRPASTARFPRSRSRPGRTTSGWYLPGTGPTARRSSPGSR